MHVRSVTAEHTLLAGWLASRNSCPGAFYRESGALRALFPASGLVFRRCSGAVCQGPPRGSAIPQPQDDTQPQEVS
jgi:hypothetical protein